MRFERLNRDVAGRVVSVTDVRGSATLLDEVGIETRAASAVLLLLGLGLLSLDNALRDLARGAIELP